MIGDSVEVTVIEVKGDQVKLGITAPREIQVHRREVYLAIQKENIDAAKSPADGIGDVGDIFRKQGGPREKNHGKSRDDSLP
jgi:carbon storage regulator